MSPSRSDLDRAAIVWLTGLSGAGKSTVAEALKTALRELHVPSYVLDGDHLRRGLCRDLGYSPEDRAENLRRAGEVAKLLTAAGLLVIAAFISPCRSDREVARAAAQGPRFIEVFIDCPLDECIRRDPKGLYRRALRGETPHFTGVSAPYERPPAPDVHLRTDRTSVAQGVDAILRHLERAGLLPTLAPIRSARPIAALDDASASARAAPDGDT